VNSGAVGGLALWGAVVAAAGTGGAWMAGARRRGVTAGSAVTAGLASVALAALAWSLLTGDFSLAYVADTTTRQGSWPYRLAGLWGGNGGSLLLWAWIILVAGMLATRARPAARLVATAIGGSVLLVAAVAADPFRRLAIPALDGGGLNPILNHPAMLYHPILLYAGHAGLVAPLALVVAGLATGRLDQAWLAATRRWMLVAWLLLGVGLVAGAHWAYAELGWGGFWGWDPVENSGLLPWLAATAFLHRARATAGERDLQHLTGLAGLAALPFCLSLLGATVSRSGAAPSVHAFAQAAAVGRGLLAVLTATVGAVLLLVVRAERRRPVPVRGKALAPQQAALAAGVILLLAVTAAVAVGTVFPAVAHAATGHTVAVTTRYYAAVVTPLAVVGLLLMGAGPRLGRHRSTGASQRLAARRGASAGWLVATAGAVVAAALVAGPGHMAPAALGAGAAFAGALTAVELLRTRTLRRAGGLMAHAGIVVLMLGVAGSLLGRHAIQVVRPGSSLTLSGFTLRYRAAAVEPGNGWQRVRVTLDVSAGDASRGSRGGRPLAVLRPGLQVFDRQAAALSVVALRSTPSRDLVVAVRAIDPATQAATLEVTVRPMVTLVWWGGLLAAAGGLVVLIAAAARRGGAGYRDVSADAAAPVLVVAGRQAATRRAGPNSSMGDPGGPA
jgi:cytochrome c-type biogenesis protein CcmF